MSYVRIDQHGLPVEATRFYCGITIAPAVARSVRLSLESEGSRLFLQVERVQRSPAIANLRLHDESFACRDQPKRLVRRALLDVNLQAEGRRQRQAAKTHIRDIVTVVKVDEQQHVTAGPHGPFRNVP